MVGLALSMPAISLVGGCRANLPALIENTHEAALRLREESASAHGLGAWSSVTDLNVSYEGQWRRLVRKLQPVLVDADHRGGSEERLLVRSGISAQQYKGPRGSKAVIRNYGADVAARTRVWFNAEEVHDREQLDAAALVADAYWLFLLGPVLLVSNQWPRREIQASLAAPDEVQQENGRFACDVIRLSLAPGFGNSESDRIALYIERHTRLMRRVRMTLNGLRSTVGALVDIDTAEHRGVSGLVMPTAFHERLLRPAPLDVHHWRLTGLDLNRGEAPEDVSGRVFRNAAAASAKLLE